MTKKIQLTGAKRYNLNGELFLDTEVYLLDDARADYLLEQTDYQSGYPYFSVYAGALAGVAPSLADPDHTRAPRTERPARNERPLRNERPGRGPRVATERPAAPHNRIIDESDTDSGAVTV